MARTRPFQLDFQVLSFLKNKEKLNLEVFFNKLTSRKIEIISTLIMMVLGLYVSIYFLHTASKLILILYIIFIFSYCYQILLPLLIATYSRQNAEDERTYKILTMYQEKLDSTTAAVSYLTLRISILCSVFMFSYLILHNSFDFFFENSNLFVFLLITPVLIATIDSFVLYVNRVFFYEMSVKHKINNFIQEGKS